MKAGRFCQCPSSPCYSLLLNLSVSSPPQLSPQPSDHVKGSRVVRLVPELGKALQVLKSHLQRNQFFRMPIAASSELGSLYCTFHLKLFEDRIQLGLFESSATCNHRSRQIAPTRYQFLQNSFSLALGEMFQRGPSLDVVKFSLSV